MKKLNCTQQEPKARSACEARPAQAPRREGRAPLPLPLPPWLPCGEEAREPVGVTLGDLEGVGGVAAPPRPPRVGTKRSGRAYGPGVR